LRKALASPRETFQGFSRPFVLGYAQNNVLRHHGGNMPAPLAPEKPQAVLAKTRPGTVCGLQSLLSQGFARLFLKSGMRFWRISQYSKKGAVKVIAML
jgi:hypothetical protein